MNRMSAGLAARLEPAEWNALSELRLTREPLSDPDHSLSSVDLLDRGKAEAFLDKLTVLYETSSKRAVASQFAKRYSFLAIAPSLYLMTMFDRGMDFSASNVHVESSMKDDIWLPHARLYDWQATRPADGLRGEWRNEMIRLVFADNVAKVWSSLAEAARMPVNILWENAAVYVFWLYEKRIGAEANERQRAQIQDDLQFLLEAPAELFGQPDNPIARYNGVKCNVPEREDLVRMRQTCCYYYQVSSENQYCSTCPIKK